MDDTPLAGAPDFSPPPYKLAEPEPLPSDGDSPQVGAPPLTPTGKAAARLFHFAASDENDENDEPAAWPTLPGLEIEAVLGYGGSATVYRAKHLAMRQHVTVKVLRAQKFHARFVEEGVMLAKMEHRGIPRILNSCPEHHPPYFVLKYIHGDNLETLIRVSKITTVRAVEIVVEVAEILNYAYTRGRIVHRDIKLANILVEEPGGQVFVVDFGIAKELDEPPTALTNHRVACYTRHYAAPEQNPWTPGQVGAYTDVFALGVTFYYLLIGKVPHKDEPRIETAKMVLPEEPLLQRIIQTAAKASPADRYKDMEEFIHAIHGYRRQTAPTFGRWVWKRLSVLLFCLAEIVRFRPRVLYALVSLLLLSALSWPLVQYIRKRAGVPEWASREAPFVNRWQMKFVPFPKSRSLIGTTRVCRAVFETFAAENPSVDARWRQIRFWPDKAPQPQDPATGVSWRDAVLFCEWLSRTDGHRYRLPTATEWEAATGPSGATEMQQFTTMRGGTIEATWDYVRTQALPTLTTPDLPNEWQRWREPNSLEVGEVSMIGWEWCMDRDDTNGIERHVLRRGLGMKDGTVLFRGLRQEAERQFAAPTGMPFFPSRSPTMSADLQPVYDRQPFTFRCVLEIE